MCLDASQKVCIEMSLLCFRFQRQYVRLSSNVLGLVDFPLNLCEIFLVNTSSLKTLRMTHQGGSVLFLQPQQHIFQPVPFS